MYSIVDIFFTASQPAVSEIWSQISFSPHLAFSSFNSFKLFNAAKDLIHISISFSSTSLVKASISDAIIEFISQRLDVDCRIGLAKHLLIWAYYFRGCSQFIQNNTHMRWSRIMLFGLCTTLIITIALHLCYNGANSAIIKILNSIYPCKINRMFMNGENMRL